MTYQNCENTIAPGEVLCGQTHCNNYQQTSTMKRTCHCEDWKGNPIPDCQKKGDSYPVSTTECYNKATGERRAITPEACDLLRDNDKNWTNRTCYCCCSCFAWGTRVAVAGGQTREIQEVGIGETILTGSMDFAAGIQLEWTERPVVFSDGTSPTPGQIVILVRYGEQGEITVTTDQPFLLADGTLKRADRLTLEDRLVDESGAEVEIKSVWLGKLDVGLHNIATDTEGTTLDGHLIAVNGVVAGDHTVRVLQNSEDFARYFAPGHDDLPIIGTLEYAEQAGPGASQFANVRDDGTPEFRDGFVPLVDIVAPIPWGAASFVTAEQAADIRANGSFRPITVTTNQAEFKYLQRIFSGFYPEIHFTMNWDDQDPNLYAFKQYGLDIVYVSGALLRSTCIGRNGLAFLMAHGVGRLIGAPPGIGGTACTGQADYFGIGYVFIDVLFGQSGEAGLAALREIRTLFDAILPEHAGGSDRCMNPSIRCRLDAMNAALAGQELPYCAGGPGIGTLKVEGAEYRVEEEATSVLVTFSEPVFEGSVGNVVNYQIRPVMEVLVAERSPDRLNQVVLNVVPPENPAGSYELTVANVLSFDGSTLDPDQSTATFTIA